MATGEAVEALARIVQEAYEDKECRLGSEEILRWHERVAILQIIDSAWKRHLLVMDHLKEAIGFRGYGQKDPLVEYKRESYDYFEQMRFGYEDEIISYLYRVEPQPAYVPDDSPSLRERVEVHEMGPDESGLADRDGPVRRDRAAGHALQRGRDRQRLGTLRCCLQADMRRDLPPLERRQGDALPARAHLAAAQAPA